MKLRGAQRGGGARVRRRRASAAERLATAFSSGGREVEFGAVDGIYRAAEQARGQAQPREAPAETLPARARRTIHLYTAGGRALALIGAHVGQHIDALV